MLAIVDYDAGNLRSVQRACTKVGLEGKIISTPDQLLSADRVIFPGVGAATSAVTTLKKTGLGEALVAFFKSGRPILGICLGAQIILEHTEEGDEDGLGLIRGVCNKFRFKNNSLKVPHMGWNAIEVKQPHPLLASVRSGDEFYFVHSYFTRPSSAENIYCVTEHGIEFCSALGRDNLFATQFHLEKSGPAGLAILERFACWKP